MSDNSFEDVLNLTRQVIERFKKIEGKNWGVEGSMIELSKQVGELSRLVMMKEQYYPIDRDQYDPTYASSKSKIADELSDIFFIVIRLADLYDIDLERAHLEALEEAGEYLNTKDV